MGGHFQPMGHSCSSPTCWNTGWTSRRRSTCRGCSRCSGKVQIERGIPRGHRSTRLARLGHDLETVERPHGGGQAIWIDRDARLPGRRLGPAQGRAGAGILRRAKRGSVVPLPPFRQGETAADVLLPGGRPLGRRGRSSVVRLLPGGEAAAEALFLRLSRGGIDRTPAGYAGRLVEMEIGAMIGFRPRSTSGPPTIDINIPGIGIRKLKFLGG